MDFSIFNQLRLEGKLCDVVIRANGTNFSAHKIILCSCSPYFRKLLTDGCNNKHRNFYNIPGVSAATLSLILDYVYTKTVTITPNNVHKLLVAAKHFGILGVVNECCQFLEGQLCLENCISTWKFATYHHCPELRQKSLLFILHKFEDIVKVSTEFLDLSAMELCELIEKDDLISKQEDTVFQAIVNWIDHSPEKRKEHISLLLPKVRLALISKEYFISNVQTNRYVTDNVNCQAVIQSALAAMEEISISGLCHAMYMNPLARPRLPFSIMLAIGGCSGRSQKTDISAYDIKTDQWNSIAKIEEGSREFHGAAHLNGSVYIVGGVVNGMQSRSVKRFDPETKTIHQVGSMHHKRSYVSVTVLDNTIYAIGGCDGREPLRSAERYKPETNQWTFIEPMQEQRSCASAATLFGKVYVCGGISDEGEHLNTAEVYNPETNRWTTIAPMMTRRSGHCVISYRNKIYAVGGYDGETCLSSAECYCPVSNTWTSIPDMLTPRNHFGMEVVDDHLFLVGGLNNSYNNLYDEFFDSNEWHCHKKMRTGYRGLSCCVVSGLSNMREYAPR
ncbi:kelch-like protein 10 [Rhinophrynus dorsalis]